MFLIILCASTYAETIKLPQPRTSGSMSLEQAILSRRSERTFLPNALSNDQISQLLWACQGITDTSWNFRAAPSAGSIYPLEIYVVNAQGVYHYLPADNKIELVVKGDKRPSLARAALAQSLIEEAPVDFIVTAVFNRSRAKFGSRAERYVYLEAGHASENLVLQATALNLASVTIGSFWDDVVASSLSLPPENEPLYIIPVGYLKQ